ncbi:MAG: type II toxin-antitoxin system RelE/ParE family toxin [Dongiaceae bacterium]
MARYRLSAPAKADIAAILQRSADVRGKEARIRYGACLAAAMRRVASDPNGRSTRDRAELAPGLRSFHVRHSRDESQEVAVANPVHVLFFRVTHSGIVEIVRVLHDRMEPTRHVE